MSSTHCGRAGFFLNHHTSVNSALFTAFFHSRCVSLDLLHPVEIRGGR